MEYLDLLAAELSAEDDGGWIMVVIIVLITVINASRHWPRRPLAKAALSVNQRKFT